MILNFEDSKYLAALYGGREITKALAAKVAEVKTALGQADDFVAVGAEMTYHPRTGRLVVIRDDREVERYDIPCPPDGYWSDGGFRTRNIGQYEAIMVRSTSTSPRSAESMFDWPIYRLACAIRAVAAIPVPPPFAVPEQKGMTSFDGIATKCMSCGSIHVSEVTLDACPTCGATDDDLLEVE